MPIKDYTIGERNGYGLAATRANLLQVKWNSLRASCLTGETKRWIDSAGIWAHIAFILAHPANTADISFGPTSLADSRVLPAGTEYEIPPVTPFVDGTWTAFDLGDWYFRCDTAPATIIVMYV